MTNTISVDGSGYFRDEWNKDISQIPKDGSMLLLVVRNRVEGDDPYRPLEDSEYYRTIGFNNLKDTKIDCWFTVGWCWCQDQFTNEDSVKDTDIMEWMKMPSSEFTTDY